MSHPAPLAPSSSQRFKCPSFFSSGLPEVIEEEDVTPHSPNPDHTDADLPQKSVDNETTMTEGDTKNTDLKQTENNTCTKKNIANQQKADDAMLQSKGNTKKEIGYLNIAKKHTGCLKDYRALNTNKDDDKIPNLMTVDIGQLGMGIFDKRATDKNISSSPIQGHFRNVLLNESSSASPFKSGVLLKSEVNTYSGVVRQPSSTVCKISPLVSNETIHEKHPMVWSTNKGLECLICLFLKSLLYSYWCPCFADIK